jgi:hypothetical protein
VFLFVQLFAHYTLIGPLVKSEKFMGFGNPKAQIEILEHPLNSDGLSDKS